MVFLFDLFIFVLFKVTEDLNADPEADSDHFMIVIIESLSLLGKIPEAIEVLQLFFVFIVNDSNICCRLNCFLGLSVLLTRIRKITFDACNCSLCNC